MWWSDPRIPLAAVLFTAACGFEPIHAPGSPAARMQGTIAVAPVAGDEPAFALRDRLTERLGDADAPAFRLEIDLDLSRRGVALTQQDFITRYNLVGIAAYRLIPTSASSPVLTGQVESFTGYSAPESETATAFASRAAGQDAELRLARTLADQIVMELAITARDRVPDR